MRSGLAGRLAIAVAVCVALNLALTLQNAWPSIWVRVGAGLSVELLAVLALIAFCLERRPALPRWLAWALAGALLLLIVGRYIAVTANALFGRSINVYFDFPQLPAVISMNAASRSVPELLVLASLAIGLPLLLLLLLRLGIAAISVSLSDRGVRRPVLALSVLGVVTYAVSGSLGINWVTRSFADPVSPIYVAQARFVTEALSGRQKHAFSQEPLPPLKVDALGGGDVFVIFLESYGQVAYGVPEIAADVRPRVAVAEQRLRQAGWHIASAYFTSPTFGGASWLAHSSFLTGRPVSNNRDYQLLLSSDRPSLVRSFSRAGYRTVALMPGLKLAWPEGRFYGFDRIYDAESIGYSGWPYGWWAIPDQFTLARMLEREADLPDRKPLFVVFPTIMSHMPFTPVPAYQSNWENAAKSATYAKVSSRRDDRLGHWENARAAYRSAVLHNIDMVQGFLTDRAPRDAVVVVLGDHQPPGVVSGPGASRLVPVHVFARNPERLENLLAAGFKVGFMPNGGSLGDFEVLHRRFVDALR